jgi:hypothetical protein
MEVRVCAKDYGWEVTFGPTPNGTVEIFDFTGKSLNSAFYSDGDNMRLTLNIADWGLTTDMVKDAIGELEGKNENAPDQDEG